MLKPRAKDQHARFAERRGALLRDVICRIQTQLKFEGMQDIPMTSILSDAVFCGNAMLSVNGSTPYNAVYGRVPSILPSIQQIEEPNAANLPEPGLIQHTHRLRELSVQAMVEGSVAARLGRTVNTRTTIDARHMGLKNGDEVDFYKEPSQKDVSGWYGPAQVLDVSEVTRGVVHINYKGKHMIVQTQRINKAFSFLGIPKCTFALFSS